MIFRTKLILFYLTVSINIFTQNLEWKAGLNYFFDNTEYEKSTLTQDQTMNGVHLSPELGMSWDTAHAIFGGIDALKISGTNSFVDKIDLIAYYQYSSPYIHFQAGAFPRANLLSNYSDFFYQDSVLNFRPIMQGFFVRAGNNKAFYSLWLDWINHQTTTEREAFYVGASAHKSFGYLFADFESYIFHYANVNPSNPLYHVCDNGLAHLSFGTSYANKQGLDTLLFAVGVLAGFERDRGLGDAGNIPLGAVVRLNVEYRGLGLKNTLYLGNPRLVMYNKYGGNLYWSNPFLRSGSYLQTKLYLTVHKSQWLQSKVGVNLHFSEKKLFYEQTFSVVVSLNSLTKSKGESISVFKYIQN